MIIAAREDGSDAAEWARRLRAQGFDVVTFFDGTLPQAGANHTQSVGMAISETDVTLRLRTTRTSRSRWVAGETTYAEEEDIPVIDIDRDDALSSVVAKIKDTPVRNMKWEESPKAGFLYERLIPGAVHIAAEAADESLAEKLRGMGWGEAFKKSLAEVRAGRMSAGRVLDDIEKYGDERERERVSEIRSEQRSAWHNDRDADALEYIASIVGKK